MTSKHLEVLFIILAVESKFLSKCSLIRLVFSVFCNVITMMQVVFLKVRYRRRVDLGRGG